MIFDMDSTKDLFEKYQAARDVEDAARKKYLAAMKSENKDMHTLGDLSTRMEDAHNKAMDIWDQLQQHRLDV